LTSIGFDIAGKAAEGFIWSTVLGVYNDDIGAKFRAKYKVEFPGTMGLAHTGGGYDTTYIFANAWKAVGDPFINARCIPPCERPEAWIAFTFSKVG
jgi:hypothetical protein